MIVVKGIFVGHDFNEEIVEQVLNLGADIVFVGHEKLDRELIEKLHQSGARVFAAIGVFGGVCSNHPQVRQEKLREIEKIVSDFEIDGVWLDSIRYPTRWEVPNPKLLDNSRCPICLEKFATDTGLKNPEGEIWVRWRCEQITNFVAEASRIVKSPRKDVTLGLFAVPWTENDFDEAITKIIGQDFKGLSKYVDIFSPMTYHKMCGRDVSWIAETVRYFRSVTRKPVLPLVQTENKPTKISPEEFRQSLESAVQKPSEGVTIFFLEDLIVQPEKLKVVCEVFGKK